jgi:hypothetical protein
MGKTKTKTRLNNRQILRGLRAHANKILREYFTGKSDMIEMLILGRQQRLLSANDWLFATAAHD